MLLPSSYPGCFLRQPDLTCQSNSSIVNVLMEAINLLAVLLHLLLNKRNFLMSSHDVHVGALQLDMQGLGHQQHLSS